MGMHRIARIPFGIRLVKELHSALMKGVRGQDKTPGEFRRSQNWIGPPGTTPETAPYVPPPVVEMTEALSNWEKFVNERETMPELIQCAIMHEQFEAIHPFLDGNGRVGRLLIPLFLIERSRLSQPLLYLSAFIEEHRSDYYELLQRVRTHGDWMSWIRFFLQGVIVTAKQAVQQADALLDLRKTTRRAGSEFKGGETAGCPVRQSLHHYCQSSRDSKGLAADGSSCDCCAKRGWNA